MTVASSNIPNSENNDNSFDTTPPLQKPSSFDDATLQQIARLANRISDHFSTSVGSDYDTEFFKIVRDHMIEEFPEDFNPITRDFDSSRTNELQRLEWELISCELRPTLYFHHKHRPGKVGVEAFKRQIDKFLKKKFRGWLVRFVITGGH